MATIFSLLSNFLQKTQALFFNTGHSTHLNHLEPIFYSAAQKTIKYAQNLNDLGNYTEIPTDEFAKRFHFKWTESMMILPDRRDAIWLDDHYSKVAWSILEQRSHHPFNDLVVCKINDTIGHGVFVDPHAKPLPAGTVIGPYAGELTDCLVDRPNYYAMTMNDEVHGKSILHQLFDISYANAFKNGNITRFIIDLPNSSEIENSQLDAEVAADIACENLILCATIHYGVPLSFMLTARTIQPGEQLGYSYRGTFWNSAELKRTVFNKKNRIIGYFEEGKIVIEPSYLQETNGLAGDENKLPNPTTPETVEEELGSARLLLTEPSFDSFDHEKRFIENIYFTFSIYENRFASSKKYSKVTALLKSKFNSGISAENKYSSLVQEINNKKADKMVKDKKLRPLYAELAFHLRKYYDSRSSANNTIEKNATSA